MRRFFWIVLASSLLVPLCSSADEDYSGLPIRYIRIESDFLIDRSIVVHALLFKEGDPLNNSSIRSSLKNIYLLEKFRQVEIYIEPFLDGVALTVRLYPEWIVRRLRFKGQKTGYLFAYGMESKISKKDIIRSTELKENEIFTQKKLEKSIKALESLYYKYGYGQCRITAEKQPISKSREIDIIFTVNKGNSTIIDKTTFEGNVSISVDRLLSRVKSKPGRRFLAQSLDADVTRLRDYYLKKDYYSTRVFKAESVFNKEQNTVDIRFQIDEGIRQKIKIDAPVKWWNLNWWIYPLEPKPVTILELLGLTDTSQIDTLAIENGKNHLNEYFLKHGYAFSQTSIESLTSDKKIPVLRVNVDPGDKIRVKQIQMEGHSFFTKEYLANSILTHENKPYQASGFRADCDSLKQLYLQNGFLDIKIEGNEVRRNLSENTVDLKITIEEGPRCKISVVNFTGNESIDSDELLKITGLKPGRDYFAPEIDTAIGALTQAYLSKGFSDIKIDYTTEFDESRSSVTIGASIEEGTPYRIEKALVKGYRKTQFSLVQKYVAPLDGQPYATQSLLKAQQDIAKLGLFSSVRLLTPEGTTDRNARTVIYSLTERPSIFLESGPGYNTDIGFNAYLNANTINLYGTNRYLGGSYFISQKSEKIQIIYREPEFAGYPVQMELRFFRNFSEDDGFDLYRYGSRVSWTYRWNPKVRGVFEYRLDEDRPFNIDDGVELPEEYQDTVRIGSIAPNLLYDTRDDVRDPHKGNMLSFKVEFARPVYSSEVDFTKLTFEAIHFEPISSLQTIAIAFRTGWGKDLPLTERFKLGGIKTIRGWGFEDIKRGDTSDTDPDSDSFLLRGGDIMLLGNIEWRVPLVFGLQGVVFFDIGNIFENSEEIKMDRFKGTSGLGLRFMTPIGPVGLDYGYNVMRDTSDPRERWSFVIGHTF